jgi:hypothetical protein
MHINDLFVRYSHIHKTYFICSNYFVYYIKTLTFLLNVVKSDFLVKK